MRSHAVLTDIVERQGYPVFSTIENALHCTRKVIQEVRLPFFFMSL